MQLQNLSFLSGQTIIAITFKAFAIVFSLLYLLYAIIIAKQTEVMNRTLEVKNNHIFFLISTTQIFAGIVLIILAIFLV